MSTMSYCAVENTASDLKTVMNTMEDYSDAQEWYEDRNEYEQRSFNRLRALCEEFLKTTEDVET